MMFKLRNESLFVLAQASGGFYNSDQLKLIASEAEKGSALLKITEDGSIGLIVEADRLEALESSFQSQGLLLKHYRSQQIPAPRACLGELCPQHEQDALGHAIEATGTLINAFPDGAPPIRIGINGCAQNCLASGTDDIHIVGEETGYKIQIGGKASELPQIGQFYAENIPAAQLGECLTHLIQVYLSHREENETFHDLVERLGISAFELSGGDLGDEMSSQETLDSEMSEALLDGADDALQDPLSMNSNETGFDEPLSSSLSSEDSDLLGLDESSPSTLDDETPSQIQDEALDSADEASMLSDLEGLDLDSSGLDGEESNDAFNGPDDDLADIATGLDVASENELELASSVDENLLIESPESQNEMLDEEEGLEIEEATEDDVARVTLAMRSESSFEQSEADTDSPSDAMADELALAAGAAGDNEFSSFSENLAGDTPLDEEPTSESDEMNLQDTFSESEEAEQESETSDPERVPDISPKFLQLQDQAKHQGSLQVRLIEDILSVMTPDGARINLPFSSLENGLKVVMNLGTFRFESNVHEDSIFIRYGDATLSLSLAQIKSAPHKKAA